MLKLSLFVSMLHTSLHVNFLLLTPSHLIQRASPGEMLALAHLVAPSGCSTMQTGEMGDPHTHTGVMEVSTPPTPQSW